jgi:hypothetical protein
MSRVARVSQSYCAVIGKARVSRGDVSVPERLKRYIGWETCPILVSLVVVEPVSSIRHYREGILFLLLVVI